MNTVIARQAGRREWISLAVLTIPCLLYAMDLTVLNLAVPQLSKDLQPSSTELLWIVDIYGFMAAGSLVTMGTLGDRIGRRRLLLIGAAAFGATSLLAAWSTSAAMLIAARALLGVAGATVAPSTLSLIRNMFADPRQRTVAVSVWITSFSVGGAIGPLLGGILLEWFWWGSVFLLAVPVMALLLVLGPLLLPEFRDPGAGRLDLLSAALSVAAVLAVIYGLKQVTRDGLEWLPAVSIVVGLGAGALGAFFCWVQANAETIISITARTNLRALKLFVEFISTPENWGFRPPSAVQAREQLVDLAEEPTPELVDVLTAWPDVCINLDVKAEHSIGPTIDAIRRTRTIDRVCVGAFSDTRVAAVRDALGPQLCTALGPREAIRLRASSTSW